MKRTGIFILLMLIALSASASVEKKGDMGLSLSFDNYSDNFLTESANNITGGFSFNLKINYKPAEIFMLENNLLSELGYSVFENDTSGEWLEPVKSSDNIDMESIGRLMPGWFADPYVSFRLKTYFTDNTDSVTMYLNPLTISQGMGIGRYLVNNEKTQISLRTGLSAVEYFTRQQYVADSMRFTTEAGFEAVGDMSSVIAENVNYTGRLRLFKALIKSTSVNDNWRSPDLEFENILTASVNEYININFNVKLLYDKDKDADLMHSENLSITVNYSLF